MAQVHLSESERDCVLRYIAILTDRLGDNLTQIWLFGSAARGDLWPDWMPMHSDIDLLIMTKKPVSQASQEELLNETYPLFLEYGRQISPQFRTKDWFHAPRDERAREFVARIGEEGQVIYGNDKWVY